MLKFLDYTVYYPNRIPWMGECRVFSVDMNETPAKVEIGNGIIRTTAPANQLTWCAFTGQKDKGDKKVYVADILEDDSKSPTQFVVSERSGVFVLNRLPDGGDIDIPIRYVRYLKKIGNVNSKYEYHWLRLISENLEVFRSELEASEEKARREYKEGLFLEWERKSEERLKILLIQYRRRFGTIWIRSIRI